MSNLLTIKPLIRNFVAENISNEFNAVYWQGERLNVPKKPYCMLTELADNPTKRTAEYGQGETNNEVNKIIQMHKQCVITIGVYVDGLDDYDEQKAFAYSQINNIRTLFERIDTRKQFIKDFSINSITGIRPLHETVEGGYEYRYEFDLTLGYNETSGYTLPMGGSVDVDISNKNVNEFINFEVIVNSENGNIEIK